MYIRKSIRSYKGRTYTNYVLVESIHTPKGPRQKTICSLGDLGARSREEWLKLTGKVEDALVGQGNLLANRRKLGNQPPAAEQSNAQGGKRNAPNKLVPGRRSARIEHLHVKQQECCGVE